MHRKRRALGIVLKRTVRGLLLFSDVPQIAAYHEKATSTEKAVLSEGILCQSKNAFKEVVATLSKKNEMGAYRSM